MTLRHLRIFREVMEKKSATRAAEALGMTQPAVSIALGELETFYETRLFAPRVGRRLVPTEAGERLLCHAEAILSRMETSVSELREKKRGAPCRIGVNVTVGEGRFPGVFAALRARLPEVRLHLTVERNAVLERLLSEGMLDLAVMDRPDGGKNRRAKPLFSEQMKAVCSPGFALRLCYGVRSEEGETLSAVEERKENGAAPLRPLSPDALARLPLCFGKRAAGCGSVPTRFSHRRVFRRCRQWRASAAARFCPLPRRGRAWRFCQPRLWTGGSPGEFCGSFRWKAHRFCGAIRSSSARGRRSRRRRRAVWRFWRRFSRTAGKVRSSGEKDGRKWKFFLFRETR